MSGWGDALDSGETIYVSPESNNASDIHAKLQGASQPGVVLIYLEESPLSAQDIADAALAKLPEGYYVGVAVRDDLAAAPYAAEDLMARADSVNNRSHDALVTFSTLAGREVKLEETVVVPESPATFPVVPVVAGGSLILALVVISAVILRRRRSWVRSGGRYLLPSRIDGRALTVLAQLMYDDAVPARITKEVQALAGRYSEVVKLGLDSEVKQIVTEYVPNSIYLHRQIPAYQRRQGEVSPDEALRRQMDLLAGRLREIVEATYKETNQRLQMQSDVLAARYAENEMWLHLED